MNSFFDLENYTENDISSLIKNEIEESIKLEYKSSAALAKDSKKVLDISKDISTFANADGGIIETQ